MQVNRSDFCYIVIEKAQCSLQDIYERTAELPKDFINRFVKLDAMRDTARGLQHLHSLSLCHR